MKNDYVQRMAEDFTELMLEGASVGINHYEKVVDPFKKHAKKIISGRSRGRNERNRSSSDDSDYEDDRPRRSYNDQYIPSRSDRRSGGGGPVRIVEEYERRRGRTLSTGGDPYSGGKPGPRCKTELTPLFFFFFFSYFPCLISTMVTNVRF